MTSHSPVEFNNSWATAWLLAMRPKTLLAAAAPVLVGTSVAVSNDVAKLAPASAALVAALLLQIGANFANDLFDFQRGTDTENRLGPMRVTQAGLLTPRQMAYGIWVVFGAAALIGVYLVWAGGWVILCLGITSIAAGITYSGGPRPYGYRGLGDLAVFVFFGLVAVVGTYLVQAGSFSWLAVWAGVPIGFLATAILTVNNLRDIDSDRATDKVTLAVILGVRGTRAEYVLLLSGALAIPFVMWRMEIVGPEILLACGTLPFCGRLARNAWRKQGRQLDGVLEETARLELIYAVLFSVGFILQRAM